MNPRTSEGATEAISERKVFVELSAGIPEGFFHGVLAHIFRGTPVEFMYKSQNVSSNKSLEKYLKTSVENS